MPPPSRWCLGAVLVGSGWPWVLAFWFFSLVVGAGFQEAVPGEGGVLCLQAPCPEEIGHPGQTGTGGGGLIEVGTCK